MEHATRKARAGAEVPVFDLAFHLPQPATSAPALALPPVAEIQAARNLTAHTLRPVAMQRQQAGSVLQALRLHREAVEGLGLQRQAVLGRVQRFGVSMTAGSVEAALQRQANRQAPVPPLTQPPSSPAEWVQAARLEVQRVADPARPDQTRWLSGAERERHLGTLRGVGQSLAQGFKTDRGPAGQRYAEYGENLAILQRQGLTGVVRTVVLQTSPAERLPLQRAIDEAVQRQALQDTQDASVLELHSLQRQLADLDQQAEQPVLERIQARRGGGSPLPVSVQRQLEAGLNHDLSGVRVHTDAEADLLSRKVNAVAFTTGQDIYFQSGRFDPNSRSGIELLAHEATHTVQQSRGQVGRGIDPDAGLEQEARRFGSRFASGLGQKAVPQQKALPVNPYAPGSYSQPAALERVKHGAVQAAMHHRFSGLQRAESTIQRFGWSDLNPVKAVEKGAEWAADKAKGAIASGLSVIPGYRELCLTFGRDLVTGKTMAQNPDAILDALSSWVPGPLKDIIQAVRESGAMGKAWAWFQGELGKLRMGELLGDIGSAVKSLSLDKAKQAILGRVGVLKGIVTGSARRIADIVLTAISAGLGPVGARLMAALRQSGDVVTQVLKNPAKFAGNLLNALKQGFGQFGQNAGKHFENGVAGWLTGATGVTLPPKFDLPGLFMTALTLMGLTYQNFRGRLVTAVGESKVKLAEGSLSVVQALRGGLHRDPGMKGSEGAVGGEILTGIKSEVQNSLILAGIKKVVTMLIPGGGFITALLGAFQSVQFLLERGQAIAGVVMGALGSVGAIAAGNIGGAANFIESSLGSAIPLALDFVSRLVGIGNLGGKIKGIIERVRGRLDALVDKIVGKVRGLIKRLPGTKKDAAEEGTKKDAADRDTKDSIKVKTDVRAYLASRLPKTFKNFSEISQILHETYARFSPGGLKALKVERRGAVFSIEAMASPFEKVGLTQAEIMFDLDDIELMTRRRGVALKASINGITIESSRNTPGKNGELPRHAEENFVANAKKILSNLPDKGQGSQVVVQLSSSPCGDPGCDAVLEKKLHDCSSTLIDFSRSQNIDLTVQILGLYTPNVAGGKALSKDGIRRMLEAGIRLETWTPDAAIQQIRERFGELAPEAEKSIRSKVANAIKALESIAGINLGGVRK